MTINENDRELVDALAASIVESQNTRILGKSKNRRENHAPLILPNSSRMVHGLSVIDRDDSAKRAKNGLAKTRIAESQKGNGPTGKPLSSRIERERVTSIGGQLSANDWHNVVTVLTGGFKNAHGITRKAFTSLFNARASRIPSEDEMLKGGCTMFDVTTDIVLETAETMARLFADNRLTGDNSFGNLSLEWKGVEELFYVTEQFRLDNGAIYLEDAISKNGRSYGVSEYAKDLAKVKVTLFRYERCQFNADEWDDISEAITCVHCDDISRMPKGKRPFVTTIGECVNVQTIGREWTLMAILWRIASRCVERAVSGPYFSTIDENNDRQFDETMSIFAYTALTYGMGVAKTIDAAVGIAYKSGVEMTSNAGGRMTTEGGDILAMLTGYKPGRKGRENGLRAIRNAAKNG